MKAAKSTSSMVNYHILLMLLPDLLSLALTATGLSEFKMLQVSSYIIHLVNLPKDTELSKDFNVEKC